MVDWNTTTHTVISLTWSADVCRCGALTCEESEGGVRLWAHYFDPAEEGECHPVRGLGESLDVPARPGLRVPELSAGEGQDVEVRGAQLPVQLLQRPVVQLRLLAVTRHVYNQRSLSRRGKDRSDYPAVIYTSKHTHTHISWKKNLQSSDFVWQKSAQIYFLNRSSWWWCGLTFPRYFSRDTVLPFASFTSKE